MKFGISLNIWLMTLGEYDNASETFSHSIRNPYAIHVAPLDKSLFRGIFYEHSHTPCAATSCDYCNFSNNEVDSCLLLGRPHRLQALVAFNGELYLHNFAQDGP